MTSALVGPQKKKKIPPKYEIEPKTICSTSECTNHYITANDAEESRKEKSRRRGCKAARSYARFSELGYLAALLEPKWRSLRVET